MAEREGYGVSWSIFVENSEGLTGGWVCKFTLKQSKIIDGEWKTKEISSMSFGQTADEAASNAIREVTESMQAYGFDLFRDMLEDYNNQEKGEVL